MLRSSVGMLLVVIGGACASAEVIEIKGRLVALDAKSRTLTIDGKRYDIAKKCDVSIDGTPAQLIDVPKNTVATIHYDDKFEMVAAIMADTPTWLFCDLSCNGKVPADDHKIVSANEIVFLPRPPPQGRGMLVTSKKFGKCKLRFEFMHDTPDMPGSPFIGVAARPPNLSGKQFSDRWPAGIEFKLGHGGFGRLVLPHPDFKAEMAYGQERSGRDVAPLKEQVPLRNGWNAVEIAIQGDNNIVAKGNGVTLNAIGNAQNVEGHIVILAPWCEFRIRNMTVEVAGESTPLSFNSIGIMPCPPPKQK